MNSSRIVRSLSNSASSLLVLLFAVLPALSPTPVWAAGIVIEDRSSSHDGAGRATEGRFSVDHDSNSGRLAGTCNPPGEARDLLFLDKQTLAWSAPADPGSQGPLFYDTFRAGHVYDYIGHLWATCIELDGSDQMTTDTEIPPPGRAFFYQVGAENPCGEGTLGSASNGLPRLARSCSGGNDGLEAPNRAGLPPDQPDLMCFPESKNTGSVHLHSGEFHLEQTDLAIPGRGFDFEWRRTYRSREGDLTPMGWNWDFSYNLRVEVSGANPADRWLYDGEGRRDTYSPIGGDCWTAAGFFRELCVQIDGSYLLTLPDRTTWRLSALDASPAAGKILEIRDRNLNAMTFGYDVVGKLVSITDTLSRPIQVSYDVDGFISAVTDFTGRQVVYDHYQDSDPGGSAGDLESCTSPAVTATPNGNNFPAGKRTTYAYTEDRPHEGLNHNLLTITDPKGQIYLGNSYIEPDDPADPSFDRIDRQGLLGGVIGYVYVRPIPSIINGFATTKTIVNDRAGNVREAFFDAASRLVRLHEYTGRAPSVDVSTNDSYNRPVAKLRASDPDLFVTRYEYNADSMRTLLLPPNGGSTQHVYESDLNPGALRRTLGNLREVHRLPGPLGGDQTEIVELFEYEPGFGGGSTDAPRFVTRHVDGRTNQTLHSYDARGNRIQTQHRIPSIVEDYEYNAFGQTTAHVLPDNGTAGRRRDEFTYHASAPQLGYLFQRIVDVTGFALTTTYEYDDVGNVVRQIDPRGHDTRYSVNALNQVVRETSREVTDGSGVRYVRDGYYDANDNIVRIDVRNLDDQGAPQPNADFTTIHQYDVLDQTVRTCRETGAFMGPVPGPPESPSCFSLPPGQFATTVYEYDRNSNRSFIRMGEAVEGRQLSNVLSCVYDERDLLFRMIRAPGVEQSTTEHSYDGNRNRAIVEEGIESGAHVSSSTYDGFDRLRTSTDAMGNLSTHLYDANGNLVSRQVDGELTDVGLVGGNVRLFQETHQYDAMDRRTRTDTAYFDTQTQAPILDGQSTILTDYTDNSQVRFISDDNAHVTKVFYDSANRRSLIVDARLNTTTYAYDSNSNLVTRTESDRSDLGNPSETFLTTFQYDNLDRLTRVQDNISNANVYAYDSRGNRVRRVDARNVEARYAYDGLNRLISTARDMNANGASDSDPDDIVTAQGWDDSSRLTSRTDDDLNATRYAYDPLNRRIVTQMADGTLDQVGSGASWPLGFPFPDLSGFVSGYDAHDNAVQRTDANGSAVTTGFDGLDRPTNRNIVPGAGPPPVLGPPFGTSFEIYQYDGLSRLVRAQDNDSLVTRSYDSLSDVTRETQQITNPPAPVRTITSIYDGDRLRTRVTYPAPSLRAIESSYDALHRPVLIGDFPPGLGTTIATYFYKGPSRVERRDYLNDDTRLDVSHDGVRRINRTFHSRISTAAPIDERFYGWDPADNKSTASKTLPAPPENRVYSYDSSDRLVSSQIPPNPPVQYTLDGDGSRLSVAGGTDPGPYTCDPTLPEPADCQVNQYTTTPFEVSRSHDTNGNLADSVSGPARTYRYDYRNQLVQYTDPGTGTTAAYKYDPLGRRIEKTVNGAITRFYYGSPQVIEEQSSSNMTLATYVWGYGPHELLQMNRGGQKRYYHEDDQGSAVKVTSSGGNVVEQYKYEDFGKPTFFNSSGTPIPSTAIGNPYLFLGHRFDHENGLGHFGSRMLNYRAGGYEQRGETWGDGDALGNARTFSSGNPTGDQPQVEGPFGAHSFNVEEPGRGSSLMSPAQGLQGGPSDIFASSSSLGGPAPMPFCWSKTRSDCEPYELEDPSEESVSECFNPNLNLTDKTYGDLKKARPKAREKALERGRDAWVETSRATTTITEARDQASEEVVKSVLERCEGICNHGRCDGEQICVSRTRPGDVSVRCRQEPCEEDKRFRQYRCTVRGNVVCKCACDTVDIPEIPGGKKK